MYICQVDGHDHEIQSINFHMLVFAQIPFLNESMVKYY